MKRRHTAGQSMIEYAGLIAIIVAALLAMQIYLKRAFSGRARQAADSIGGQYDPGNTASTFTTKIHADTKTESTVLRDQNIGGDRLADVMVTKSTITDNTTTKTGNETVGSLEHSPPLFEEAK